MDIWTESQGEGKKAREGIELEKRLKMGISGKDNISKDVGMCWVCIRNQAIAESIVWGDLKDNFYKYY